MFDIYFLHLDGNSAFAHLASHLYPYHPSLFWIVGHIHQLNACDWCPKSIAYMQILHYTLRLCQNSYWKWSLIVNVYPLKMVFHSYVNVYQRVIPYIVAVACTWKMVWFFILEIQHQGPVRKAAGWKCPQFAEMFFFKTILLWKSCRMAMSSFWIGLGKSSITEKIAARYG